MQGCLVGACREKIDRDDAVMSKAKADLAVVVVRPRNERGGRRRQVAVGRSGPGMEGGCVMVPGEQDSLDQDREGAGERGNVAAYPPSPTDQNHRRAAPRISMLRAPPVSAEFAGQLIYYNHRLACKPVSRERRDRDRRTPRPRSDTLRRYDACQLFRPTARV